MSEDTMTTEIDETPALTIEQVEAMLAEQFPPVTQPEPFPGDPTATWVYWDALDPVEIREEWVWERLRNRRNALLSACDWRVVMDAPWPLEPWEDYRQALRDLPGNTEDPRLAVWPEPPA
jgi:hypothetical protein